MTLPIYTQCLFKRTSKDYGKVCEAATKMYKEFTFCK